MALDVLIVDDEEDIRDLISDILKDEGFTSRSAATSSQAFQAVSEKTPNAIILDIWLQDSDLDGLGILELIKKKYPLMPIIVISGHGTIETAVSAIKMGAYDYLEKPFTHDKLMILLRRACESARLKRENIELKSRVVDKTEFIGLSPASIKLKSEIDKAAPTTGRIMIHGEVGSGKELVARLIHKKSLRSNRPFIIFSPKYMRPAKIQQDLFGEIEEPEQYVLDKKICLLEAANNGTLYIEDIEDLPPNSQNHLLKFLGNPIVYRQSKPININIRLITSTTQKLQEVITNGKFRQDLFYRLNVIPVVVPNLIERKEDIAPLTEYFIKQLVKFSGLKKKEFSEEAITALQSYHWPGNIRQLRNVIEWTLIMNSTSHDKQEKIRPDMLPQDILTDNVNISKRDNKTLDLMSMPLREAREVFEKQYLTAQMNRFNSNISKTSSFVGMERSALHRKLKTLNIHSGKIINIDNDIINDN